MPPRVTNAELDRKLDKVIEQLDEMNHRQRDDHDEITRLKERQGTAAKAQAAFTAIAATFAAWLGAQR